VQEQFRRRLGEVGEIASPDHARLRAKPDRARNAAGRHGVVASDHDHPDSSPLACAYRVRNVASRRVLQPGQTQERQGLERRTIRHRSCERRERKDTQTFPAELSNTLEPFRSCRFIHNGITVFACEALCSCEHRFGSALDGKKVNSAAAVNGGHHVGHNDRLPALAADLIRRQVTVIVTPGSTQAALAAKAATTTIPIVFQLGSDPIQAGLVASLNRPGGNVTGVTSLNMEVGPKRVELLHELVPTATTFALLVNPTNPALTDRVSRDTARATRTLGLQLHVLQASTEREFDTIFARLVELQAGALVIGTDVFFSSRGEQLGALTARHAVAAAYQFRQFAAAGGLMSYGGSITDQYRQLGTYTARILKGERPADLPIQQSTKAELIINLKTAKALGLMVPLALIGRADEVIE
jgi:ABC-type uncharacterized transport system substrate-binding protein